jgi:hypothetical protein
MKRICYKIWFHDLQSIVNRISIKPKKQICYKIKVYRRATTLDKVKYVYKNADSYILC